jgi:hypothetical protein
MTKTGKCETCRRRKIKCDESWPTCDACQRRGRICVYTHNKDDVFVHDNHSQMASGLTRESSRTGSSSNTSAVASRRTSHTSADTQYHLSLKRTRDAQNGRGQFLTFKPMRSRDLSNTLTFEAQDEIRRSSSISPGIPLAQREALAARLVALWGTDVLQVAPWGDWIKDTASFGTESDLAVDYVLRSVDNFCSRTSSNLTATCTAGQLAMRSLRKALEVEQDTEGTRRLLTAVMLHYAAEVRSRRISHISR